VERKHMRVIQQRCGEGPKNTLMGCMRRDDAELPAYLLDKDGNQVTPSIKGQKIEDMATYRRNRVRLKEMLEKANDTLPDAESETFSDIHMD